MRGKITFGTVQSGQYKGFDEKGLIFHTLVRISNDGGLREQMDFIVSDIDAEVYPTAIVPDASNYSVYYRFKE